MKIIHLISGGDVGGAKTHVHSLLQGLGQTETVQMVCFMDGPFAEEARQLGIPTHIIKSRSLRADCAELVRFIKAGGFEIIHCHGARANMMGMLLRKRVKLPVVTTVHSDYRLDYLGRPIHRLTFGTINTIALRFLDYHIGVSDSMARLLISRGFDPKTMFSIYNGVDFTPVEVRETREAFLQRIGLSLEPDSVVFGIAARISPVKDMTTLVKAFAKAVRECPSIRLVIAGDGEQAAEIKALAAETCPAGTVAFAGWLTDTDSFYNAIDVNMLTSLSETFPYALTEGARMHCATIASRVGGVPDLIEDGVHGLLFEARDADTLAAHITNMARDAELRTRLQEALYQRASKQYSVTATVERQKQIYETILRCQKRQNRKRDGIMICGAYGRGNAGDDAILQSIIDQIRRIDRDIPIEVLSRTPKQTRMRYRVGSCYIFNPLAFLPRMRKTELYISGGGTLMQNATSNRSLRYYLESIKLAKLMGNKVMLYGCGIGPVNGNWHRRKTARVLNNCADMITLRDNLCQDELKAMGVTKPQIEITADPALLIHQEDDDAIRGMYCRMKLEEGKDYAMFVLRPWQNFNEHAKDFAAAAQRLYDEKNCIPVFFPLEPNRDLQAIGQVTQLLQCPYLVLERPDTDAKLVRLFSRMRIVISMRLHALIFAAGQGVPLLGVVYDPKVEGFMEYLGQKNYLNLQSVSEETLRSAIDKTMESGIPTAEAVARLQNLAERNEYYLRQLLEK